MTLGWWQLDKKQREQVYAMFPATTLFRSTHRPTAHDDYAYEITGDGQVLSRIRVIDAQFTVSESDEADRELFELNEAQREWAEALATDESGDEQC